MKAERSLSKVEAFLNPLDRPADPGSITDEERFMFRKLGLRMKAFLLLGKNLSDFQSLCDSRPENEMKMFLFQEGVEFLMVQWRTCTCIGSIEN